MDQIEYYCDACGSDHVEVRVVREPNAIIRKPMSSMPHPNETTSIPAVMKIDQYEAHCNECGHTAQLYIKDQWNSSYNSLT
jgi:uncharacterized Zn finger protein